MSTMKFDGSLPADDQENDTNNAVTPVADQSIEAPSDSFFANNTSGVGGEASKFTRSPALAMAHAVGSRAKLGVPGSIWYNEETEIASPVKNEMKPENGATIAVITADQYYTSVISDAEYKAGKRPVFFRTEQEARGKGYIPQKEAKTSNGEYQGYIPGLRLQILVKAPEGADFPFELDGELWAPAQLNLTKMSFWRAGTSILQALQYNPMLKKPNFFSTFQIWSRQGELNGNVVWNLEAKKNPKPQSQAWLDAVKQLFSQTA